MTSVSDICVWLSTNDATEIAEATKNVLQINVDQNLKNFGNNLVIRLFKNLVLMIRLPSAVSVTPVVSQSVTHDVSISEILVISPEK